MIFIPAIDLRNGCVVRLTEGDYDKQDSYSVTPVDMVREFESAGVKRIHIVDLDAARSGKPTQHELVKEIAALTDVPVELGGGIRSLSIIENCLSNGVSKVILGTKACLDRHFLKECLDNFRDRIIVGIDAKKGMVATDGWTRVTDVSAVDMAKAVSDSGGTECIFTDIARDGMMKGPNAEATYDLCKKVPHLKVIHSGGISCLEDVRSLINLELPNLFGVISGKAIYENRLNLRDAVELTEKSRNA